MRETEKDKCLFILEIASYKKETHCLCKVIEESRIHNNIENYCTA